MNTSVASGPKPMPPMSIRWLVQENSATSLPFVERRRRDDEVVEVPGAHPRIVGDVGIARLHGVEREVADEVLHRLRHRVDVAGRAGDGLRQHAALPVEHAGREIAALAHDRRERGAHQHLRLLLDHRDQAVPHDLQVDQVGGVGHAVGSPLHHDTPRRVDARVEARGHECRGLVLGDDRRARHAHARPPCARADTAARRCCARRGRRRTRGCRPAHGARFSAAGVIALGPLRLRRDQHRPAQRLDRGARDRAAEQHRIFVLERRRAASSASSAVRSRTGSGTVISCPCPT